MTGVIFDIKEMAVHDGPGIRTTVFLKGCPLRCKWCHNPEGLSAKRQLMYSSARCKGCGNCQIPCDHPECRPFGRCIKRCPENCLQITGEALSARELADRLLETAQVLGDSHGGFTFSGGEPLFQPEFLMELMGHLQGNHLCIETSGFAKKEVFRQVIDRLDYIIMDIKLVDPGLHKQHTGVDNRLILENFEYLKQIGKPFLIRTPLIPGITDTAENLTAIKNWIGDSPWEQLPYNTAAGAKYTMLGMT